MLPPDILIKKSVHNRQAAADLLKILARAAKRAETPVQTPKETLAWLIHD